VGATTGSGPAYTAGMGLSLQGTTFSTLNTTPMWNASKLVGRDIMTTLPTVGQVLKWGGGSWYPADDNVATAATTPPAPPIQTFFKNGNQILSPGIGNGSSFPIIELTHTVILTKKSRLVISGMIDVFGPICVAGCAGSEGDFNVNINGSFKLGIKASAGMNSSSSATISNFMIDLNPGTYKVDFQIWHLILSSPIKVKAQHSSIMVIPLE
jgi:hypothetical protein